MQTHHRIITGDSRDMKDIPDESVHLIITSPPYWQLKDYGAENQIGFHDTYEQYINNLNVVWKECERVLHKGCRLCVNIGDQFARAVYYGRYKVIPIRTEIIKFCESVGFDYMGAVIWQKVTTSNTTGGGAVMGSFPYPRNGILKLDYEFILLFKKQGAAPKPDAEAKAQSQLTTEEWNEYFQGHWNFAGARQENHLAMFPEELPSRLIKMFSFAGDTILDPFLGSGTTSLAAKNLNRHSIGYEINPDFLPIIKEKLQPSIADIFNRASFAFTVQKTIGEDFARRIAAHPYVFHDPHQFNNKIDIKSLRFGSKMDNTEYRREEYYTVKDVLSPELIRLNTGVLVRLLGVRQDPANNRKATEFLAEKTRGQRVYIKYDHEKYDEQNRLLCYLYLQNRTFINAHLIKAGLVLVDNDRNFSYKQRFNAMRRMNG